MNGTWMFLVSLVLLFSGCSHAIGEQVDVARIQIAEEFTEDTGLELAEKFCQVVNLFDSDLSSEEKAVYYTLIPMHLQSLYKFDDWQKFGNDLDACKTADDIRQMLADDYVGITQPELGRPGREESIIMMDQLMAELKLADVFPLVYYGPLHAASPYTEAWEILAMQLSQEADGESLLQILLTQTGSIVSVHGLSLEMPNDCVKTRDATENEKEHTIETVATLAAAYSICRDQGGLLQPILLADCLYQSRGIDEPFACLWVEYDPHNFIFSDKEDDSAYGDVVYVGINSQRVYYWQSFVSKSIALSTITEEGVSFP